MPKATPSSTRTEKDSLGTKEIPADVYYGIQTARAVENFPISGLRAHPSLIRAIAMVKEAAALANRELGLVDEKTANAIIEASKEVEQGKWDQEFVVDVFQAGAGVSFHMNATRSSPTAPPSCWAASWASTSTSIPTITSTTGNRPTTSFLPRCAWRRCSNWTSYIPRSMA